MSFHIYVCTYLVIWLQQNKNNDGDDDDDNNNNNNNNNNSIILASMTNTFLYYLFIYLFIKWHIAI